MTQLRKEAIANSRSAPTTWIFSFIYKKEQVMNEIVITPKTDKDTTFLVKLLRSLKNVSSIEVKQKETKSGSQGMLSVSEASLAKDWLSEEDNRWDELLKK
jgi:hypothetical protein